MKYFILGLFVSHLLLSYYFNQLNIFYCIIGSSILGIYAYLEYLEQLKEPRFKEELLVLIDDKDKEIKQLKESIELQNKKIKDITDRVGGFDLYKRGLDGKSAFKF